MNLRKRINNHDGVVLFTVLIVVIVMMIFTVSLISITVSQNISNHHQIERIQAEQLAKGSMWYNYMNINSVGSAAVPPPVTLDGKQFTVSVATGVPDPSLQATPYTITVDCPTCQ